MKRIDSSTQIKKNFLEIFRNIASEDIQSLLDYNSSIIIEKKIKRYCTKEYPLKRVYWIFHVYASIAYITAELKVNAKIYIDHKKRDFMLLSYKKNSNPDTCCVVYSTLQSLCNYPFFPVPVSEIFTYVENGTLIEGLIGYFDTHAK